MEESDISKKIKEQLIPMGFSENVINKVVEIGDVMSAVTLALAI